MQTDTLGNLRSELRVRLGYASSGASGGVMQENLNSILRQAQLLIYEAKDWARLRRYSDTTVGVGQYLIDYPTGANPDRIRAISTQRGTMWSPPLRKGISPQDYTNQDSQGIPYKWEPYAQIELFPKADQIYPVRIFYIKSLDRFTQDADASTVDRDMIFAVALGNAKAHYRQPDAQIYMTAANDLLLKLKAQSWGKDVFRPSDYESDSDPLPKPLVV